MYWMEEREIERKRCRNQPRYSGVVVKSRDWIMIPVLPMKTSEHIHNRTFSGCSNDILAAPHRTTLGYSQSPTRTVDRTLTFFLLHVKHPPLDLECGCLLTKPGLRRTIGFTLVLLGRVNVSI